MSGWDIVRARGRLRCRRRRTRRVGLSRSAYSRRTMYGWPAPRIRATTGGWRRCRTGRASVGPTARGIVARRRRRNRSRLMGVGARARVGARVEVRGEGRGVRDRSRMKVRNKARAVNARVRGARGVARTQRKHEEQQAVVAQALLGGGDPRPVHHGKQTEGDEHHLVVMSKLVSSKLVS